MKCQKEHLKKKPEFFTSRSFRSVYKTLQNVSVKIFDEIKNYLENFLQCKNHNHKIRLILSFLNTFEGSSLTFVTDVSILDQFICELYLKK